MGSEPKEWEGWAIVSPDGAVVAATAFENGLPGDAWALRSLADGTKKEADIRSGYRCVRVRLVEVEDTPDE